MGSSLDGVSSGSAVNWDDKEWDKPLPGAAEKTAAQVARSPWLRDVTVPTAYDTQHPLEIFSNPALAGPPVTFAAPPPPAKPKPAELPAAPNARSGVTLANVAKDLPTNTHTDLTRGFSCGVYRLHPEVAKQPDGNDAIVHWVAYNNETQRTEFLVGPDSLKTFVASPREYAIAAANAFMGGDDATTESVKTIDVAMREGPLAGLKQAAHASRVAWSDPDWVVKTITNGTSTFAKSVEVADALKVNARAAAAEDVMAGRKPPESYLEHVNKDLPFGKQGGDRMFNCANSAIATDAVLAGNPASALPGGVTSAPDLAKYYGANWSPMMSSAEEVEAAMEQLPEGSRAIVIGAPPNASIGHFYNAASGGGVVRFFDGQSGTVPSTAAYTRFFILRTN